LQKNGVLMCWNRQILFVDFSYIANALMFCLELLCAFAVLFNIGVPQSYGIGVGHTYGVGVGHSCMVGVGQSEFMNTSECSKYLRLNVNIHSEQLPKEGIWI